MFTPLLPKMDLALRVLAASGAEAQYKDCGLREWLVPLDSEELEDAFLVDYRCDECEAMLT